MKKVTDTSRRREEDVIKMKKEISSRNLPVRKGRPERMAEKLTIIFDSIICKIWGPHSRTQFFAAQTRISM
jgi:hypothetical protein